MLEVLDDPPLIDAAMLELTRWMAGYYACSWGQALDAVVPAGVKKQAGTRVGTFLTVPDEVRQAREALELPGEAGRGAGDPLPVGRAADGRRRLPAGPVRAPGRSPPSAAAATSTPSGGGSPKAPSPPRPASTPRPTTARPRPAPDRRAGRGAGAAWPRRSTADAFATFLLHGVTGSGKTEVYLSAIERVVARGREAIVLVPEISLTPQTIRRFRRRFARVAVLHSHLSDAERHRHWRSIAAGEVQVVVGARSAVFAPTRRLGLIVIDEEHESDLQAGDDPALPRPRRRREAGPAAKGSRSCSARPRPSLETWRNAELGRYTRLSLTRSRRRPADARGRPDRPPPREAAAREASSEPLRQAMIAALDDGGQVILLLNRRGFHTFIICPNVRPGPEVRRLRRGADLPQGPTAR